MAEPQLAPAPVLLPWCFLRGDMQLGEQMFATGGPGNAVPKDVCRGPSDAKILSKRVASISVSNALSLRFWECEILRF